MRNRSNQHGQELAELGIVLLVFVFLVGFVMQFGYAFMVVNMITHAARDGARLAASWQSRGACGQITNYSAIQTSVQSAIATVVTGTFNVSVNQTPAVAQPTPPCTAAGTTPRVTVNVQGCVPYIFDMFNMSEAGCPGGFNVNRTITFNDELRV